MELSSVKDLHEPLQGNHPPENDRHHNGGGGEAATATSPKAADSFLSSASLILSIAPTNSNLSCESNTSNTSAPTNHNNNNQNQLLPEPDMDTNFDDEDEDGFVFWDDEDDTLLEHHHDCDMQWSLWSNGFFLTGGMTYVACSVWEYRYGLVNLPYSTSYYANYPKVLGILWTLGPLVYLFNSMIDVSWAFDAQQRQGLLQQRQQRQEQQQQEQQQQQNQSQQLQTQPNGSPNNNLDQSHTSHNSNNASRSNNRQKKAKLKYLLQQVQHQVMGHRRDINAATAFGIAALLGMLEVVVRDQNLSANVGTASIHMYCISATIALLGQPAAAPITDTAEDTDEAPDTAPATAQELGKLGDIFFGVATVVDTLLCDLHFDDDILWWPIVSAVLWLCDALLYIGADYCTLCHNYHRYHTSMRQLQNRGDDYYYLLDDGIQLN